MNMIQPGTVYLIESKEEWERFVQMAHRSGTTWCSRTDIKSRDFGNRFSYKDVCIWINYENRASHSDYEYYQIKPDHAGYPYFINMKELVHIDINMEAFDALLGGLA